MYTGSGCLITFCICIVKMYLIQVTNLLHVKVIMKHVHISKKNILISCACTRHAFINLWIPHNSKKISDSTGNVNEEEWGRNVHRNTKGFFLCPNCSKPYKYKTSVYIHLENDCGKPKYYCEVCSFSCKYSHVLQRHMSSITHRRKESALIKK